MDFKAPYKRDVYLKFFQNQFLPEDFKLADEKLADFKPDRIKSAVKIGEVPSLELIVLESEHESENDPRVSLSRETFRLLANYGKQRALVLFISKTKNFRLSLVTIDLQLEGTKVKKEYSNPKRFSFFLGPDAKVHTPQQYLEKRVKDFEDLKQCFSIEVVNKDFYNSIATLFTKLTGGQRGIGRKIIDAGKGLLKLPQTEDDTVKKNFAVRLIGRLIFCWFLKKKDLLPEKLLSLQAIGENSNYYHNILEPLFFEVLNTPLESRITKYKKDLWAKIPFLNGGLFTPHEDDFYKLTFNGISEHLNTLIAPDNWLKELFEVFETYNFTIDENTSIDVELSIEPEMLGRIFENLLAEINPETGETARKATGSYYTPRPIVEYMVDESLKQYLLTKTGLLEGKISSLLSYSDENIELAENQKDSIIDALGWIKVIDPACGSGAFPMGILQKILLILQKLDPDSIKWLDKLLSTVPDPMYQKELKRKIDQPSYLHKLGIIRDCIYGVDIQPIAVEISKLRCFLSLIVDEKVDDSKPNRGVEHLPNLEFKFVCANTLIGLPKQDKQQTMFEDKDSISELKKLRDEYLNSFGDEKKNLEKRFTSTQSSLRRHTINWGKTDTQTAKLGDWQPFEHKSCSWFDSEWMFGVKDGFDIVIANPPYGADIDKLLVNLKPLYSEVIQNYADIYKMFFKVGLDILKLSGIETFITPNTFLSQPRYKDLRKYLLKFQILRIVNLGEEVFEQCIVPVCVTIVKKSLPASAYWLADVREQSKFSGNLAESKFNKIPLSKVISFKDISLYFGEELSEGHVYFNEALEIKDAGIQYHRSGIGLKNKGGNDLYERIFDSSPNKFKRYKPVWYGKLINKYWMSDDTNEFFNLEYQNVLREKESVSFSHDIFNISPKIIWRQTASCLQATIDDGKHWFRNTIQCAYLKSEYIKRLKIHYVLGVVNSKYIAFLYNKLVQESGRVFPQVKITHVKKLPLAIPPEDIQNKIANNVLNILDAKRNNSNADTSMLETQIDQMVYKLYDLTPEEIAIVEGKGN